MAPGVARQSTPPQTPCQPTPGAVPKRLPRSASTVPTPEAIKQRGVVLKEFREGAGVYDLAVRWGTCIPVIESILREKVSGRTVRQDPRFWERVVCHD